MNDRITEARRRLAAAVAEAERGEQEVTLRRVRGRMFAKVTDERITELRREAREAFLAVRSDFERDNRYTFNRIATRVDELTWALVHAGILPAHEVHSTITDFSDQWGNVPGCPCGTCPADHVEDCRCIECRHAAEDAAWRSPEAVERRRLVREFAAEDDE